MKFNDKLYQLRRKKGLSQEEFGEKLNVTRQSISKWELGINKPDTDKLIEISKLFDVDMNLLVDDNATIEGIDNVNKNNIDPNELKPRKWLLVVLIVIEIILAVVLINKVIIDKRAKAENGNSWGIFDIFKRVNNSSTEFNETKEKINKDSFNGTYEIQTGTRLGSSISYLLDDVITNNKKSSDHIITVVYDGTSANDPNEIKELKKSFKTLDDYEVSLDYDENGYVNKIEIEALENEETEDISTSSFNWTYESKAGTQWGISITHMLDDIITNNKTKPNHIVRVIYGDTNTIDEEEIRSLKSRFEKWTDYEVILDYDENGYVYQVTIR